MDANRRFCQNGTAMSGKVIRILFTPAPLKPKSWLLWVWVSMLILIPTTPWSDFVGHSHWDKVQWIPFGEFSFTPKMIVDVVGNFGWFLILGYLLHYRREDRSNASIRPAVMFGLALSIVLECFQVYCHNRFPSMTDVTCNVLGTIVGAALAREHEPIPTRRGHTLVLVDSD